MSDIPLKPDDLPTSWAFTTLGAVVDYGRTTKAEPSQIAGDDWVLELEDIEKDSSKLLQRLTFAQRQSKSTKSQFQAGDVLYGKLRPYLNKVLIADQPGYCTTEIVPIKTGAQLDNRYFFYWLKHPAFLKYVEAESHGMNMPRLGTDTAKTAPFVLAPRNEQTRIADQLDKLLARVQACNDRLDAIPALLKRFRQAVLTAATSGALTEEWRAQREAPVARMEPSAESENCVRDSGQLSYQVTPTPDSASLHPGHGADWRDDTESAQYPWQQIRVSDAGRVQLGRQRAPKYHSGEFMRPYLRVQNVFEARLDLSDVMKMDFPPEDFEKYRLHPGDILLNEGQSPEYLGRPAIYRGEFPGACFTNTLIRFQAYPHVVSEFALIVFRYQMHTGRYVREGKITTNIAHLGANRFANVEFPLPPLDEQSEIVRRVEALFQVADRIEARHTAARALAQRLTPLLLAKAFRGELVPQDPDDEPASTLLARIRGSMEPPAPKPKRAKRIGIVG